MSEDKKLTRDDVVAELTKAKVMVLKKINDETFTPSAIEALAHAYALLDGKGGKVL